MCTLPRADSKARLCTISPARRTSAFSIGRTSSDDIQYELEGRPDRFSFVDRSVPMDNLLQHLGVSHKPLPRCNQALQEKLRLGLVRVRRTNQVHRNVGVDEDQA